ncbi:1-acyl-sn-glycerol-3-phosphate acyltransferase [Flavitalea sp.]|nr:1-acyl-sn-glycerol-3-phosphate acyltransferase [Flavitalea sp.]
MQHIFSYIYNYFRKNPVIFYLLFLGSLATSGFFASKVRFEEDISSILPKDKKTEKLTRIFNNSKFADRLVVTISLKDTNNVGSPDSMVAFAQVFSDEVRRKLSPYISRFQDKVDDEKTLQLIDAVSAHLPLYLDEKDYRTIDSLITPGRIRTTLERNIRTLTSPAGLALKTMIARDPVGINTLGLAKMQGLQYDENFELYDNFVVSRDYHHLLLFITPKFLPANTGKNAEMLEGLDRIIDSLHKTSYQNLETTYFGAAAVSVGNALQLRKDSLYTQGFTILFIVVFLGLYFRKKLAPFIILIPVIYGVAFSLAMIFFIQGKISVIALGTGSIVLGIAVNYSLHVFNHYRHNPDMNKVLADLAMPLTIGSLTTIGGFLCLQFVESEMLKDLGLFAAFSLIGASVSSLLFLPQFIVTEKKKIVHKQTWIDKIADYRPEKNKPVIIGIAVLTIIFAIYAGDVQFEPDMIKMNYMSDQLRESEKKLNNVNAYALQSVYLVTEAKSLDEALRKNERLATEIESLKNAGTISRYAGVSSLILSDSSQAERISRWNNYWTPARKSQLLKVLETEGAKQKFRPAAFDQFRLMLNQEFQPLDTASQRSFRQNFLDDFITVNNNQVTVVTLARVDPGKKNLLYNHFENNDEITVLDRQHLTGTFVRIINDDFNKIAWMSALLVFSVLLVTYGRIELALVSFIPMMITWIWILGLMALLGINFNIINIIISALIFGLGDDYSLFIMDGLVQEYKTGKKNLSSFKSSIVLSAITTIAGLGVLIFAKHPALRSIALVSIIGISSVAVISQVLIPFLFDFLITRRVKRRFAPWTLLSLLISVFAFIYFMVAGFIVLVTGFIILKLNPFSGRRSSYFYHSLLMMFNRSIVYIMFNFKKRILNPRNERLTPPAVLIANHQSFLDILEITMLHPKLIMFIKQDVFDSPLMGPVVRMAGYYPVSSGGEESVETLKDRVKEGYSIFIFPEGTRRPDGVITRFHKGAFLLAEKLGLDIQPVLLHGTSMTLTKRDLLLKNSPTTVKYLPRIKFGDKSFGNGYVEQAKLVGRYMRHEYEELRTEIEKPAYFREQLIYNYLYKGPVLEWYMRIKTKLEDNYELFDELVPRQGNILDIGCGYGFMDYMLHFVSPSRVITGIDYDEEKIATANNCYLRTDKLQFYATDAMDFAFQNYDTIILADMLHYLQPAQQKALIEKCFLHTNPGGIIIIRDGNKDLKDRHRGTKLSEFFSTKLIGFNKTSGEALSFLSGDFIREMASVNRFDCREIDNTKLTSNIVFVLTKR